MEFPSDACFSSMQIISDSDEAMFFKRKNPNSMIDGKKYVIDPILKRGNDGWQLNATFIPKDLFKFKVSSSGVTMDSDELIHQTVYDLDSGTFNFVVNGVYQFKFEEIDAVSSSLSVDGEIYTDVNGRSEVSFGEMSNGKLLVTIAPLVLQDGVIRTITMDTYTINIHSELPANYL